MGRFNAVPVFELGGWVSLLSRLVVPATPSEPITDVTGLDESVAPLGRPRIRYHGWMKLLTLFDVCTTEKVLPAI